MSLLWKRSLTEKIVLGSLVCIPGALGVYNLWGNPYNFFSWFFIALVVYFFSAPYISTWSAGMTYNTYKDIIGEPRAVELLEEGIMLTTEDTRVLVRWSRIKHWQQDDRFILIYVMPQVVHIIPKSLQKHGFDIARLIRILEEKFEE